MKKLYVAPEMEFVEVETGTFIALSLEVDNGAKDNLEGDAKMRGEDEDGFEFGSLW